MKKGGAIEIKNIKKVNFTRSVKKVLTSREVRCLKVYQIYTMKSGSRRKPGDDVGFFESALAGVATGLWNIPKGVFSFGAEIYDLIGDTNTAKEIEDWFDDVNPWDDEAEARTVGKVTQAITQVAPMAVTGAIGGVMVADRIRKMSQAAIAAKKSGNSNEACSYR